MKNIRNEKMYKRNAMIGKITNYAALAMLAVGIYYYIQYMQEPDQIPVTALVTVLLGYLLTQFSTFFTARWGREPRPDQGHRTLGSQRFIEYIRFRGTSI